LRAAGSPLARADEKEERYSELAVQADAILLNLAQLCREMSNTRGELLMATELVARGAADMFAVLLPWRRGRIQSLGMPSSGRVNRRLLDAEPERCRDDDEYGIEDEHHQR
jgi:hypothetical protein